MRKAEELNSLQIMETYKKHFALAQAASENIHLRKAEAQSGSPAKVKESLKDKYYLDFITPDNQQLTLPVFVRESPTLAELASNLHLIMYAIEVARTGKSEIMNGNGDELVAKVCTIEDLDALETSLTEQIIADKEERMKLYIKMDELMQRGSGIKR